MIYALIVLYNKKCNDSITYNSIKNHNGDIKIIVFDNSEEDYYNYNKEFCQKEEIIYFSQRKNLGLSKAYNYVISNFKFQDEDYLLILDDDTEMKWEYLEKVKKLIDNNDNSDIYIPIVKSKNNIISPANIEFGCRVKKIKNLKQLNMESITAINSGMIIKTNVYNNVKYNEDLFLDYIDHDFLRNIRKQNKKICIIDEDINQNFSRDEKNINLNKALVRFKIYKRDFKKYCYNAGIKGKIFYRINILKLILVYTLEYKTLLFIKARN